MSQHCACANRSPVDPEQTVDDNRLDAGAALEVRLDRRPVFYPQLEDRGFEHDTSEPAPGLVRVLVRRRRV